jgi:peptidoglycan/xylan/chitin deacetylase (PgdA/CDA1 family)
MKDRSRHLVLQAAGRVSNLVWAQDGAILCLHSIAAHSAQKFQPMDRLAISPSFLEKMIVEFRRCNIDIVSIEEALRRLQSRDSRRFVAFTLDDGYADNFTEGFPIFLRHRVPVTIFLTTGFIDRTVPMWWEVLQGLICDHEELQLPDVTLPAGTLAEKLRAFAIASERVRDLPPDNVVEYLERLFSAHCHGSRLRDETLAAVLDWNQVRAMAASGLVSFGCHTVHHPVLSRIDCKTIAREIGFARDRIAAELGEVPRLFAYPFGSSAEIGSDAPQIVAQAGFDAAFTTSRDLLCHFDCDVAHVIPRISFERSYEDLQVIRALVSGIPYALRDIASQLRGFTLRANTAAGTPRNAS